MNKQQEHITDKFLNDTFENYEELPPESVWQNISTQLDALPAKNKKAVIWWPYMLAASILLLLGFGLRYMLWDDANSGKGSKNSTLAETVQISPSKNAPKSNNTKPAVKQVIPLNTNATKYNKVKPVAYENPVNEITTAAVKEPKRDTLYFGPVQKSDYMAMASEHVDDAEPVVNTVPVKERKLPPRPQYKVIDTNNPEAALASIFGDVKVNGEALIQQVRNNNRKETKFNFGFMKVKKVRY